MQFLRLNLIVLLLTAICGCGGTPSPSPRITSGNVPHISKLTEKNVGVAATAIGTVLLVSPDPVGKVTGAVLVLGGAALIIHADYRDDCGAAIHTERRLELDNDQKLEIARTRKVTLRDSDGNEKTFDVTN